MRNRQGGRPLRGKGQGVAFLLAHKDDADGPCLIWPLYRDRYGYGICTGRLPSEVHMESGIRTMRKAARLMCELVNGPPPSPKHHCAHSCGRGQQGCIHPKHVRWATPKENMADSVRMGAVRTKGKHPRYKLTREQVAEIKALRGTPYDVLSERFGVKQKQIGKIMRGEHWPNVPAASTS